MTKSKVFSAISLALFLIPALFLLTACGGGEPDEVRVQGVMNVPGVTATVETSAKKSFLAENDSAERVQLFGEYGELTEFNVKVAGSVLIADCEKNSTPMDADGNKIYDDATASYHTDFFELQLLIPDEATKFEIVSKNKTLEGAIENVKDGYVVMDVEWLLGVDGEWGCQGSADTNDGYFYYAFLNDNDEVVKNFFVHITYEVEFTQQEEAEA